LKLPAEENPFLGYRAVRIYAEFESLFRTQIRALIRASAHGKLKILIPMVATIDEVRWVKKIVAEEQSRCDGDKLSFDKAMEIGVMIEVPSAALAVDALGREVDFFSIGTNDLLQYFMAVDRANPRVAGLYNPLQPAFLRLLKQTVDAARAQKKWTGLCGEMGGQPRFLPLLIGLGLDEISVASPGIAHLKSEFATINFSDCRQLLDSALNCATANEVAVLLEEFASRHPAPLLDADLIIVDSDAVTREEAIKQAVSQLYVLGRTQNPHAVEETIWEREKVYSTGFGHGFAMPHCKTNAVQSNSLVLLKLRAPVAWPSLDNEPVGVMILLAMRETNSPAEHMKIFAKLARQVMNEEFRARLQSEPDPKKICAFLLEKLVAGH
jgi:fructose-specific phosphotransferase system IIA component